nr:MAG TPA: hypothetical protein [Caudoviricetes sp.]
MSKTSMEMTCLAYMILQSRQVLTTMRRLTDLAA